MIQFQKKRSDGSIEGRKDGQTLFHKTLPATAGGPIVKNKEKLRKKTPQIMNFWVMKTAKSFYNCKVRKSKNVFYKIMKFLYNLK